MKTETSRRGLQLLKRGRTQLLMLIALCMASSCQDDQLSEPTAADLEYTVYTSSPEGFQVNATLVTGTNDAILIDAMFTIADAERLRDAIRATGKNLTTIYITHAHPDHYFGLNVLQAAFPNAAIVALPSTLRSIEETWRQKVADWRPMYGELITDAPIIPTALATPELEIEGNRLPIVGSTQGDEANNSYVWIPTLRVVVTGDIVYNGVFPWTLETSPTQRRAWQATLDRISALNPETVVPGHQNPALSNSAASLAFTRDYLQFYDEALAAASSSQDLQDRVKQRFPGLQLDVILSTAADAAFPAN